MKPISNPPKTSHQFKCNRCGKGFTTAGNLKRHILNIHVEPNTSRAEQDLKYCQYCHKKYSRQDYLTQHIKSVHERANKYTCDQCGKTFTQKGSLTRHVTSIHDNVREFCCKHCSYQAISYNDLKKHAANAHFHRARYECTICGHGSWCASIIKQHIINLHSTATKTQSRKCRYCGIVINLSKESYPLHVAACKSMGVLSATDNEEASGKRKHKRAYSNKKVVKKEVDPGSSHLTDEIPWDVLCNVDNEVEEKPSILHPDGIVSPTGSFINESKASGSGTRDDSCNVDSVIGYIKDLQNSGDN